MKIAINDHRKLFTVQREFTELFPHLKIEFLSKPSKVGESPSKKLIRAKGKSIGDCRLVHTKGELTLSPSMTVADLKQSLSDIYGLAVIVYKKYGAGWVETEENGRLTLQEQDSIA